MSLKIPKGIIVRGGFRGMIVSLPSGTTVPEGATVTVSSDGSYTITPSSGTATTGTGTVAYNGETTATGRYKITQSTSSVGYYYPYQAVLSGDISSAHKAPRFTWNSTKHQYTTEFYGNSYHVVTFATKGFDENGRALPLGTTEEINAANGELAKLEGFMVKDGYAYNSSADGHPHNAYGGGVYMVPGACLEDVAVENCEASRDGGGIYMDGGGKCCHVYVADCQALGINLTTGYGGGICVDENKQVYPPVVKRSAMINCVARYGGGLANRVNNPTYKVTVGSKTYDMRYNEGFEALVVSGNTALTEAGGIYALNGGAFTHCTVARNACYGSGNTVGGIKTGQSAGFYARNNVIIANSILWGGSINDKLTNAAQYASSRSTTSDKAEVYYVAMNNAGRVDFTGVKSSNTIKLSSYNNSAAETAAHATSNSEEQYVDFVNPLSDPGHCDGSAALHFKAYESGSSTNNGISYKIQYVSACTNAGVPTTDIDSENRTPATKSGQLDVFGDSYSSNPSLGAYVAFEPTMGPDVELVTGQTITTSLGNLQKGIVHIFVDPNTEYSGTESRLGCSWATPVKRLRDAIEQIETRAQSLITMIETGQSTIYTGGIAVEKVVVHVKEGTTTVQGANVSGTIRSTSLTIPKLAVKHVKTYNSSTKEVEYESESYNLQLEILGGYKSSITDDATKDNTTANFPARHGYANAAVRNPILYPTIVTGYVMDGYAYTTPHIFKMEDLGTQAVTVDGLQIRYANAWSTKLENTVLTGGAFTIKNASNVTLKNVLIADCQAVNGPAIYETGNSGVTLENCIIHNNTINVTNVDGGNFNYGGIMYVERGSTMTLNHCDILRNVGYAFYNDGTVTMDNSICYANMSMALDDTNGNDSKALKTFAGSGTVNSSYNSGDNKYNLFDTGSASDSKATTIGTANQTFTFVKGTENHYPSYVNPTKNSGVSENGDATYYGKSTSFEPQNTNNCVNAATTHGVAHVGRTSDSSWGTDMTTNVNRDYGGLPDIGAVESHESSDESSNVNSDIANSDGQRAYGTLFYVKDYGKDLTAGGSGMSWSDAINGNAYYYSDGSHGSATSKDVSYDKVVWKEVWTETAATIPNSTGIVLKNGSNYLVYKGNGSFGSTTTLKDATLFNIETSGDGYIIKAQYNSSTQKVAYDYQGNYNSNSGYLWKSSAVSESGTSGTLYYEYSAIVDGDCPITGCEKRSTAYNTSTGKTEKNVYGTVCPDCNGTGYSGYLYHCRNCGGKSGIGNIGAGYIVCTTCGGDHKVPATSSGTKYLTSSGTVGDTQTQWSFYTRGSHEEEKIEKVTETSTGINGLQYAVNKANENFNVDGKTNEVWVASGTYTSKTAADDNSVSQPYAYMMKEGADVYGGFPAEGNPCQDQREPKTYVTILQPQTSSPFVTMSFYKSGSGSTYTDYMTVSNWGANAVKNNGSEAASVGRVLVQPTDFTTKTGWDGFTLRYGYLNTAYMNNIGSALKNLTPADVKTAGGAGVLLQGNGVLTNCEVKENLIICYPGGGKTAKTGPDINNTTDDWNQGLYTFIMGGAGIFMTGDAGAVVENCEVSKNELITKAYNRTRGYPDNIWMFGGGIYQNGGEVYNTIAHDNSATTLLGDASINSFTNGKTSNNEMILGAGIFVASGNFYNNTIVKNVSTTLFHGHNNHCTFAGVHVMNAAKIYNSVIADNVSHWGYEGASGSNVTDPGNGVPVSAFSDDNSTRDSRDATKVHVTYSFVDVNKGTSGIDLVSANDTYSTNIYLNTAQGGASATYTTSQIYTTSTYRLVTNSPAINTGTDYISDDVKIPDVDAAYDDRIQDCNIDMGAYEYNGTYAITPDVASESGKAIFYVTPEGNGKSTASDPANAACAAKLQKVIDAAGRYKYQNSGTQVIVKVANSYNMLYPSGGQKSSNFTYYATRTTDQTGTDQDTRIWSIIVPRGVEVWGGYTDVPMKYNTTDKKVEKDTENTTWSNDHNGFYSGSGDSYKDLRDVVYNKTYFDATYYNTDENTNVNAYHVVSFSDNIFDGNGTPYKTGDASKITAKQDASENGTAMTLGSSFGRGIVDGIFITGGMADANTTSSKNSNIYGGAAIVTDCGHVRNCIVRSNQGNYGGGLAITKGGLVSGCLVDKNTGWYNGGGIYVLTDDENTNIGITSTETPHVYTSTIANNTADVQGGGVWFDTKDNVRINSSVIWQNHCSDMPNVAGTYSPEKASDDATATLDYYPIAYSAVQNLRASGTNNISISGENKAGARFWKDGDAKESTLASETDFSQFGLYKLTNISALLRVGMPVTSYNSLVTSSALAANDFANVARDANSSGTVRTYIDMGARALYKVIKDKELMLRLFVAQADDVDADAETDFSTLTGAAKSVEEYYSQQGSSFAYPFHNLQDALDYIYTKRGAVLNTKTEDIGTPDQNANYLPFEICVAKGSYYPTKDLLGNYGQSFSNTFAIPEGVSIYGGFNATELGSKMFYGRYYKANPNTDGKFPVNYTNESTNDLTPTYIKDNVTFINVGNDGTEKLTNSKHYFDNTSITGYTLREASPDYLLNNREREDINGNSIVEPWEFKNQTILSGATVGDNQSGVFHVLTLVPDQNVVGVLPPKGLNLASTYNAETDATKQKYLLHEQGQYSVLNGLIVTKGYAHDFANDANMEEYSKNNYYAGGGMIADGNRYDNSYGEWLSGGCKGSAPTTCSVNYMHTGVTDPVAYRDQVVTISQCKFLDNEAGYGGAIAANTTIDIYNSAFENNLAVYGIDKNVPKDGSTIEISYPGQGGAIQTTYQLAAYNTVFANNEARSTDYTIELKKFPTYKNPTGDIEMFSGIGGAVYTGFQGHFHLVNCDIVRNMANHYPAVFTLNPNTYQDTYSSQLSLNDYNQMLNTVVWGNEINSSMAAKFSKNDNFKFAAKLICNYGAPNRNVWDHYGVNYGASGTATVPTSQDDLDDQTKFAETAWFSAYEEGYGVTCKNTKDIRDVSFRPYLHAGYQIKTAAGGTSQNSNIAIDSENKTLEGPNFSDPSKTAGTDGYDEGADWSPARLNNLTDNGSGKIVQQITKNSNEEYDCSFPTYSNLSTSTIAGYWSAQGETTEATTRKAYSNETDDSYITSGAYTLASYSTPKNYTNSMPLGEDNYMKSLNGDAKQQMLYRISYDPNPTKKFAYIDIGVYEYPHTPLKYTTEGDECDILWVSSEEKPDNGLPEGSAWTQPTSDLQRAIETLLSSRNGHRKEIRLMDGSYSPMYTIEGNLSFYLDTKYINSSVVLPTDGTNTTEGLGVKSFTIKGGYSKDLNEQYDVDKYPAIIRQKKQTESGTHKWDHLFYVKDATQRNGVKAGYEASNGYGWWTTTTDQSSKPAPTTIPIQIDGVSLVNNQTDVHANGAVIYYANQTFDDDCIQTDVEADIKYYATAPKSAYISLMDANGEKVVDTDKGLIYYTDDNHTTVSSTATSYKGYYYKSVTKENPYKMILSRSTVMNSSAINKGAINSATYIGKFGGEALVYNTVFHSNRGNALNAYATKTINNTFALNTGMTVLNDKTGNSTYDTSYPYNSTIYNSVFWKNNKGSGATYGSQFNLVADASTTYDGAVSSGLVQNLTNNIKSNAYTGGNNDAIDYDADNNVIKTNNWNAGLVDNNSDAVYGPNFEDPAESATTDAAIEARSFRLLPNLRLVNHGDNNTKHMSALTAKTALYNTGDLTATTPVFGTIYDYAWVTTTMTDAASNPRLMTNNASGILDLGAFEYQSKQNRVLYVDPNRLTTGTGLSWASPFGYGNIQAAIDAAAVYYKSEHEQTYVFVKANSSTNLGLHSDETLTMRNGVAVYGSVCSDYLTDCEYTLNEAGDYKYSDAKLTEYVKDLKVYHRNGVISPIEGHTRIFGIKADGVVIDDYGQCVVDGFDVTAQTDASSNEMVEVTEPVINIKPRKSDTEYATGGRKMCIANVAVHGNDISSSSANLIYINNALLYEALVYNNKVNSSWSALEVDDYGYAASVTVEGKTTGADGSTTLNNVANPTKCSETTCTNANCPIHANTTASHVYNSITNYSGDAATWKTLSGYCYKMDKPALNYQLTEKSKYIDAITVTNGSEQSVLGGAADEDYKSGGMPANLSCFINYWPERSGTTWSKADRDLLGNFRLQTLGTVAGDKYNGNDYSADGSTPYVPKLDRGAFETWDIQQSTKNCYPDFSHAGSVEYIRAGKSFIIDGIAEGGNNNPHNPGFVLLEMGANLYGNGRRVEIPYISVESYINKTYIEQSSSYVMSAPFTMDYDNTTGISESGHTIGANTSVDGIGYVTYDSDGGLIYKRPNITAYTYDGSSRSATDFQFNKGTTSNSSCWKSTTGEVPAARGVLMQYNETPTTDGDIKYRVTAYSGAYETKVYKEEINFNNNHVYHCVPLYKYNDSESTDGGADFTDANDQGWNCIGLPYLVCNYHPYYKAKVLFTNGEYTGMEILKPTDTKYSTETGTSYAMTNPKTMWLYYNGNVDASGNRLSPDGKSDTMGDGGFYAVNSWDNTSWHQTSGTTPRIWMGEGFFVQNQDWEGDEDLKFYVPVAPELPIKTESGNSAKSSMESFNTRYYYETDITAPTENGTERTFKIRVVNRTLTVSNLEGGENIRLYNSAGQLLQSAEAESETYQTNVESGVLIVSVNGVSTKFFVK